MTGASAWRSQRSLEGMSARVMFYTREGCHLCVEARETVATVCSETGDAWQEADVDQDPQLAARFGDEVPVVTVDDQVVGFWRINRDLLRLALQ